KGQNEIASSIVNGIIKYKEALNSHATEVDSNHITDAIDTSDDILFRVQIGVGSTPLETTSYNIKGLEGVERQKEGEFYKYYYGKSNDYIDIQTLNQEAKKQGFPEAFIVAFKNGKKISTETALKTKAN